MYDLKFKLGTVQTLKSGAKVKITRIQLCLEAGKESIYYYNHMDNIKFTADMFKEEPKPVVEPKKTEAKSKSKSKVQDS